LVGINCWGLYNQKNKMKMTISSEREEEIRFEEIKRELNYLSKEWNVYFIEYLGNWKIIAYPKKHKKELENETIR